jgi:hypothetical protein
VAMLMPIFRELGKKSSARATTRRTNSCMRCAESVRAPAPGSGRASWHAETGRHLGDLGVRLPPGVPREVDLRRLEAGIKGQAPRSRPDRKQKSVASAERTAFLSTGWRQDSALFPPRTNDRPDP